MEFMNRLLIVILFVLSAVSVRAQQVTPTEQRITAAIKSGLDIKETKTSKFAGFMAPGLTEQSRRLNPTYAIVRQIGGFRIRLSGPLDRVEAAARTAALAYQPFIRTDVTEAMLAPIVTISADPLVLSQILTGIVIQPKGVDTLETAIRPREMSDMPVEWANAFGGNRLTGNALAVVFHISDLPAGDFDVLILSRAEKPKRTTIAVKDREKLR